MGNGNERMEFRLVFDKVGYFKLRLLSLGPLFLGAWIILYVVVSAINQKSGLGSVFLVLGLFAIFLELVLMFFWFKYLRRFISGISQGTVIIEKGRINIDKTAFGGSSTVMELKGTLRKEKFWGGFRVNDFRIPTTEKFEQMISIIKLMLDK